MLGWLARKVSSSYSRWVRSMALPARKTWWLSVLIDKSPDTGMAEAAAEAAELLGWEAAAGGVMVVRRMLAPTRATSSRIEKGLVI